MHSLYIYCKGSVSGAKSIARIILTIFTSKIQSYKTLGVLTLIDDMVALYGASGKAVATGMIFPTGESSVRYGVMGASGEVHDDTRRLIIYGNHTNFDQDNYPYDVKTGNTEHIQITADVVVKIIGS